MANKEPKNCWEFWNCRKDVLEECFAYTMNSGRECWKLVGSITNKSEECPKLKEKIKDCWECNWFKKLNPDS